ncbi:MAG TPA: AAA family ATPase [Gammaproteobacteria bacterium]
MAERLPEGTVTILFADVVSSTSLAATVGDRVARERLRAREEIARDQVARHGGRVVKGTGDGLMAAFTSARRAVACAVEIQRAVERLNLAQPRDAVQLRIGLHSGEVVAEADDLHGAAANAAARIESAAPPDGIWVSETVRLLLGPGSEHRLADVGERALKGFDAPWRLFEIRWREQPSARGVTGTSPLVGRERERAIASACLDRALSGQGALVLLGGEPGVGKTRLAKETAAEARERGFLTLVGRCYEMEGGPPHGPLVEIIEGAADALSRDELAAALGDDGPEIAKLVPRLAKLYPDMPPAPERPAPLERRFQLDALGALLQRLAAQRPLLLVLDDLHWVEESTLVLLRHLLPRAATLPVVIVVTYRDTELFPERPFTAALPDLQRAEHAVDLVVPRLPRAAVADLLRAFGGQEAPPRLLELVITETEGNPFFVEQVLKHLTDTGRLFDAQGRWRTDTHVAEDEVPSTVRRLLERRLARVTTDCRRVLTWAAIVGRRFSFELLSDIADVAEESLLAALDAAQAAMLLAPERIAGEWRLAFAHELIRQTLLGELSPPRRQRLHARAADAIEAATRGEPELYAADIAYHLQHAGPAADPERAARYLASAGKQALAAGAFEDARRAFDEALARLRGDTPLKAEVLYRRGVAAFSLGRWDLAEPDWTAALAAAERCGAAELTGHTALAFGMQLAYAARPVESIALQRRALAALGGQTLGVHARLRALYAITGRDLRQHDYDAALAHLAEAARIAAAAEDLGAQADVVRARAHLYWRHMLMVESADEYARACTMLEQAGELYKLANARTWHALALVALGRFAQADAILDGLAEYCERVGDPGALFAARRAGGYIDVARSGDLERYNAFAAADLAFLEALGSQFRSNSHAAIALGRFWDGRWDEALEHARRGQELSVEDSWSGFSATALLLVLAYRGDAAAVQAVLAAERKHLPVAGRVCEAGAWELLPAAVEALAVIGDRAGAAALYPVAREAAAAPAVIRYSTKTLPHTTAGIAAMCAGDASGAVMHFEAALGQAHALPNRLEQPEVRRWLATLLLERDAPGDRARARTLLAEAVVQYAALGMPRHRALAAAMLG